MFSPDFKIPRPLTPHPQLLGNGIAYDSLSIDESLYHNVTVFVETNSCFLVPSGTDLSSIV